MSYRVHIIRDQIIVFDGMGVVTGANGEAVLTIAKQAADNLAPLIEGALDVNTFAELLRDVSANDVSSFVRDSTASTLGVLAGYLALPLGPASALIADQMFSEAFKYGYDGARAWSQNQDWGKFFDYWERSRDSSDGYYSGMSWPVRPVENGLIDPDTLLPLKPHPSMPQTVNDRFASAQGWQAPRDPLGKV